MTQFSIERHEDGSEPEIVTRDPVAGGRWVLWSGPEASLARTTQALSIAYNIGRRDEGAIRAAAFSGLASASPLSVAAR